jgi:hypothetical protein
MIRAPAEMANLALQIQAEDSGKPDGSAWFFRKFGLSSRAENSNSF